MSATPELPVPDAALRRHDEPARPNLTDDDLRARLARIAAPIVAAELRRMAEGYAAGDTISESFARDLRARADEIERQQP